MHQRKKKKEHEILIYSPLLCLTTAPGTVPENYISCQHFNQNHYHKNYINKEGMMTILSIVQRPDNNIGPMTALR